jgi:homocysteine S-methyltransferase
MRRALEAAGPGRSAPSPEPLRSPRPEQPEPAAAEPTRSRLAARLDKGQFVVAAELDPPRGLDVDDVLGGVRQLLQHGIDLVDVPVGSRARANMGSEALALLLEREAGVETLVHYTCRDRNLLGMQSDLIGAFALGLRNLVGETGDAALEGATVVTTKVYDIDSIGLTNMVHRLNQGLDVGGSSIGHSTGWHIGVRLNPTAVDPELEARRFAWKVDAGAHFCLTRPVFDVDALQRCLRRTEATPLKVLLTLWPLGSWREAEFLANEVPGLSIPAPLLERMRQAAGRSEEHERAEGVAIARELLTAARTLVQGVVVSTHGSRYQAAVEVVEAVDAP